MTGSSSESIKFTYDEFLYISRAICSKISFGFYNFLLNKLIITIRTDKKTENRTEITYNRTTVKQTLNIEKEKKKNNAVRRFNTQTRSL